jgi:hypothetical protein
MATTTAFTNATEANLINHLLRGTTFAASGGAAGQLYLALMSNVTSDAALAEIASGTGGYTTNRIAIGTTPAQVFGVGGANTAASTATPGPLTNIPAVSFTATGAITIAGIAVCNAQAISATASTDASILFYGDITGGPVTLGAGQTITFPNNTGISITLD